MVKNDQVAILKVEPVQFIARGLGVHDIFVDDECGALSVGRDALADLPVVFVSPEPCDRSWSRDMAKHLPERAEFAEEIEEFFGGYVVAEVLDEQGSTRALVRRGGIAEAQRVACLLTSGARRFLLILWRGRV